MNDNSLINNELLEFVERLQLPRKLGEYRGIDWLEVVLANNYLSLEEGCIELRFSFEAWNESLSSGKSLAQPPTLIREVIESFFEAYHSDDYDMTADSYIATLNKLVKGGGRSWTGLHYSVARRLLSRARTIGYLQEVELYSSSQISRLFQATETSLAVPFQAIQKIGDSLGGAPKLPGVEEAVTVWNKDLVRGDQIFSDSPIVESCELLGSLIGSWIQKSDLSGDFKLLCSEGVDAKVTWPYMQILYWSCFSLEYYDHPPTNLYEFNPRGATATRLFENFELATANPVLNNAKGVSKIDRHWALNRSGADAHALVRVLETLDDTPYLARKEVAKMIRAWVVRTLSLMKEPPRLLEGSNDVSFSRDVTSYICGSETYTQGVIEQRVIDALAVLIYERGGSWQPRGLKDSVNASNLAKKKFGDIEFASAGERCAIAIEAHGGRLSKVYVEDHARSLARTVHQRLEESWKDLARPEEWSIEVVFVAHSMSSESFPQDDSIEGVLVNYKYMNYYEFASAAFSDIDESRVVGVFDEFVVDVLNGSNVRQSVRDTVARIGGLCYQD